MTYLQPVFDRVTREPALLGAFVLAVLKATWPDAAEATQGAWLAGVAWFIRSLSTSNKSSEEKVEQAKYVGLVEGEHRTMAAEQPPSKRAPRPN